MINKDWNIFLKFLGEVTRLVFKNNLRIILGSKSEKFKNVKDWKEAMKKNVFLASEDEEFFLTCWLLLSCLYRFY